MSFFNGKKKGVFLLFLILSTLLFLASCASDEQAWEDAVEENTIESYKEYLEKYPEGEYAQEAKDEIHELSEAVAWEDAVEKNTVESYKEYLEKYPEGEYAQEAKDEIHELSEAVAWEDAVEENTIESYKEYLEKYPEGEYAQEAKEKIPFHIEIVSAQRAFRLVEERLDFDNLPDIITIPTEPPDPSDVVIEIELALRKEYFEEFINRLHKFQLMANGEECPSTGTSKQIYGEEKDTVMLYYVVPKDVLNFNLFADDYLPINFTPEEEIKDEIKAETDF